MKRTILLSVILIVSTPLLYSQEKMEVDGAIIIKDSEDATPAAGTIRFNPSTNDFEGWNGQQWMSLTRLREPGGGVTDIDGNSYTTVKLGTQEWMVENLKTTKYNDGANIPNVTIDSEWEGLNATETGAWCYYSNNSSMNDPYGKLYNWYAVNTNKLCPTGWIVPNDADWMTLIDYLGGSGIAGGKMKEEGTAHWNSPNTGATNESGFTGVPGGFRDATGPFFDIDIRLYLWSSTETSSTQAMIRFLSHNNDDADLSTSVKRQGFSVRCIRD